MDLAKVVPSSGAARPTRAGDVGTEGGGGGGDVVGGPRLQSAPQILDPEVAVGSSEELRHYRGSAVVQLYVLGCSRTDARFQSQFIPEEKPN